MRVGAVSAVARLGGISQAALLVRTLDDENPQVQKAAREALVALVKDKLPKDHARWRRAQWARFLRDSYPK